MRIALKIDVADRRAAAAVPALIDILRRHHAGASFASLPDHAAHVKIAAEAGFEVGLRVVATPPWWSRLSTETPEKYEERLLALHSAHEAALGTPSRLHAAADWSTSPHGLRLTQRLGFAYASDTRGRHPFLPVWDGEIVRCPQIPTTLPTLDELAVLGTAGSPVDELLALTANSSLSGHVFSLRLTPALTAAPAPLEALLTGWREQGYELTSIQALASQLDMDKLARHEIVVGKVPGRSGTLLLQGEEFLASWRQPA